MKAVKEGNAGPELTMERYGERPREGWRPVHGGPPGRGCTGARPDASAASHCSRPDASAAEREGEREREREREREKEDECAHMIRCGKEGDR